MFRIQSLSYSVKWGFRYKRFLRILNLSRYTHDYVGVVKTHGLGFFYSHELVLYSKKYCAVWNGLNGGSIRVGCIRDSCHTTLDWNGHTCPISIEWGLLSSARQIFPRNRLYQNPHFTLYTFRLKNRILSKIVYFSDRVVYFSPKIVYFTPIIVYI